MSALARVQRRVTYEHESFACRCNEPFDVDSFGLDGKRQIVVMCPDVQNEKTQILSTFLWLRLVSNRTEKLLSFRMSKISSNLCEPAHPHTCQDSLQKDQKKK